MRSGGARVVFQLAVLVFLHMLVDFYSGLLLPLPEPTLTQHFGVSLSWVMLLVSSSAILVNVAQPLAGKFLPQKRLPVLLWLCPLLSAVVCLVGISASYGAGWLFLMVSGLGIGVMHPEAVSAAQALSGKRLGLVTSIFMSFGFFGFSLGSLVGGWWGHRLGLDYFWVLATPALAGVFFAWASGLLSSHPLAVRARAESEAETIPFRMAFSLSALIAINLTILYRLFPVYWIRRFGADAQAEAGSLLFLIGLTGAAGSFAWGMLSDRIGAGRVLAALYLLGLPAMMYLSHGAETGGGALWAVLLGGTVGGTFPLAVVLARRATAFPLRLRLGLCIGGAWGLGEIGVIGMSALIDRAAPDDYRPVQVFLRVCPVLMAMVIVQAAVMVRRGKRFLRGP